MKTFKCWYETKDGLTVDGFAYAKIAANDYSDAARIYGEKYPSKHPRIMVGQGFRAPECFANDHKKDAEEKARAHAARIESLETLATTVESTNGNLEDLSYAALTALIENMRDFRDTRDSLSPEECALRERLYMTASFDSNLQTLLQTDLLRNVKSSCEDLLALLAAHTKSSKGSNKNALLGAAAGLAALNDIRENTE